MAWRLLLLPVLLLAATLGSGCSTIIRPTRPSTPLEATSPALAGVRFDGPQTQIREPGMPLAPSRSWQREVANYTASTLNVLVDADELAPAATTVVSFDLATPSVIQIGTWKEMTITLTSNLPDGNVVKSEPVVGPIDDTLEYVVTNGLGITGTLLDITAGVSSIFFIFNPSFETGLIFVAALVGGLTMNIAQSASTYVVASSEETRWSNLYAKALAQHAEDVRQAMALGPPTPVPLAPGTTRPPPIHRPPPGVFDPSDGGAPPPLLDPTAPALPATPPPQPPPSGAPADPAGR